MKKTVGILLIVLGIVLGYFGVGKISNSGGSVKVVGIELSASDEGKKTEGYVFLGFALASFIGGIILVGKKD